MERNPTDTIIGSQKGLFLKVPLKTKLLILFVDFYISQGISAIIYYADNSVSNYIRQHLLLILLLGISILILYHVLPEYFFKQTLGMKLFGAFISYKNEGSFKNKFPIYSLVALLDRRMFLIVYIARVLILSEKDLLFCEKISGLEWKKRT